jgi:hypothetical protein
MLSEISKSRHAEYEIPVNEIAIAPTIFFARAIAIFAVALDMVSGLEPVAHPEWCPS